MLTAFDVGIDILVLISAILATARGLTREVLSLATWAGSAAIAIYMWQYHPEIARGYIQEQIVADVATVVVTFIIALIVLHLITMRIADFVVDSRIGPLDRTLGFVFGVLRGIVIALLFTRDFAPMEVLFAWQMVGDVVKISSWVLSFVMLGRGMTRLFIVTELVFALSFWASAAALTRIFGFQGVAIAYLLNYTIYMIAMWYLILVRSPETKIAADRTS